MLETESFADQCACVDLWHLLKSLAVYDIGLVQPLKVQLQTTHSDFFSM